MTTRRSFLIGAGALAASGMLGAAKAFDRGVLRQEINRIAAASGGRLGVSIFDVQTLEPFSHNGDDRFPMCSTFNFLLPAPCSNASTRRRNNSEGSFQSQKATSCRARHTSRRRFPAV